MVKDVAYLFPGQGSQHVGMGKDLYETYPAAKRVYDRAAELLNFDLREACFEGPPEKLTQTRFSQPAIFVASLAALFLEIPALSLTVSAAFVLLMSGLILYETGNIIHGGETNYVLATVTLFVSIFNLFTSLLQLLGFMNGDD